MSFYGSIYYQVAQSFAKILFKNSGITNIGFLAKPSNGEIEADGRTGVFSIDSGNRWIQINPNGEGCQIWHAAPNTTNPTIVQGMEKADIPAAPSEVIELASGDYFKIPVIQYDDAGHILPPSGEAVYYRMPVIDILDDVSTLEAAVTKLESDNASQDSKIAKNVNDITGISNRTNELESTVGDFRLVSETSGESLSTVIGNVDSFRIIQEDEDLTLTQSILNLQDYTETNITTLKEVDQGFTQTIGLLSKNIEDLLKEIDSLKDRVTALEG